MEDFHESLLFLFYYLKGGTTKLSGLYGKEGSAEFEYYTPV